MNGIQEVSGSIPLSSTDLKAFSLFCPERCRGIVQHPVDGKLYMKNYYGEEFYRLNNEPFDGTAEFLFYLSGNYSQAMFTFSADGQYILLMKMVY